MVKRVRRSNVKDGVLLPLGNGFSLVKGDHPNKTDDVDIGPNNKNGLSVNDGEILQQKGNTIRVFSAEPMLGGVSPVQLLYGGMAPDKVFTIQEQYKQANRIADDGTKYKKGGKKEISTKKYNTPAQRDSAQVNVFKAAPNNKIQTNRINHRVSLEKFVKENPTLYGLNTADFVDFLLDNATMESGNSSTVKHGSMYGYYQLKGLSDKSTEAQQHKAAYKHLSNLFNNVLTDADIEQAKKLGISQAALLHKTWNQERKVLNYIWQNKDSKDGLGTKLSEWGNNNDLEIDYSPYVMKSWNEDNYTIQKGDNYEKIMKNYRGYGNDIRTFNNYTKDANLIFGADTAKALQIGQQFNVVDSLKNKKQFGGKININPLGERPNAKFGKEMKNKRIKSLTGTQLDAIGAGINTLGSLVGAGIQQGAINGLTFTPHQYSLLNPVKLKTKINIKPQVSKLKEIQAQLADAARRTSGSSRTAYQKILAGHNRILDSAMDLYGRQENMETELINQDRLNQQQIAATNSKNVMDTVNYNIEGKDNLNNQKRIYTSNNWTTALNTTAGAWAGPNGFIDRSNARRVKAGELYVQAMANPDAARLLYGDINFVTDADKRKAFKTIYNFLNDNNLG